MVDWSKPIQTRDGRSARVICMNVDSKQPVALVISNDGPGEYTSQRRLNGKLTSASGGHLRHTDIINVPAKPLSFKDWWSISWLSTASTNDEFAELYASYRVQFDRDHRDQF